MVHFWQRPNARHAMIVGLLLGFSFLCKWTASIFLSTMFCVLVFIKFEVNLMNRLKLALLSFFSAIAIALPPMIFLIQKYPIEMRILISGIISPVSNVVQGHGGEWYYYLDQARQKFGEVIYLPIGWVIYEYVFKRKKENEFLFFWILVPIVVLSAMTTKRSTYLLIIAPAFFVLNAQFILFLYEARFFSRRWVDWLVIFLLVCLPIRYGYERLHFTLNKREIPTWKSNFSKIREIVDHNPKTILFSEPRPIEAMFYSKLIAAYPYTPTDAQIRELEKSGFYLINKVGEEYLPIKKE